MYILHIWKILRKCSFLVLQHLSEDKSQATRPVVTDQDEPHGQVITNLLSDNPSRNHITASCSKRRCRAERINRNLSRDPRWTAPSAANTATRADSPTPSSSNSKKSLSEQRQIFWPSNQEQAPRRHVCSKEKHIGKLSSLVYCSYPPNRLVYSQGELKKKELAATRPSNGDILAMMFIFFIYEARPDKWTSFFYIRKSSFDYRYVNYQQR